MTPKRDSTRPSSQCPICGKGEAEATRPFCSGRCADIDLNRWFTGHYTVPVVEIDEGDLNELENLAENADGEGGETWH
ncbi:MAG: DNA gyrase inhibitor YacG [Alphaproteobacteria bacterium]